MKLNKLPKLVFVLIFVTVLFSGCSVAQATPTPDNVATSVAEAKAVAATLTAAASQSAGTQQAIEAQIFASQTVVSQTEIAEQHATLTAIAEGATSTAYVATQTAQSIYATQTVEALHITQTEEARPKLILDLMDYAPSAVWQGGELVTAHGTKNTVSLTFNDRNNDQSGFARYYLARMENGEELNVLHTHPMWVDHGCIKGWFKSALITIPENAYFWVEVGFVDGAGGDGVTFWVFEHHVVDGKEEWEPIIQHKKAPNGSFDSFKIDLSYLAGKQVYFELRVDAGNTAAQDWAVWYSPSVWANH